MKPLLEAKHHGAKMILDGTSKYDDPSRTEMLYTLADGLFINTSDYQNLKEHSASEPRDILFENGAEFVCITDGSHGATCYYPGGSCFEPSLHIPVVDSTGAGDSFAGAFLYGLGQGYSF